MGNNMETTWKNTWEEGLGLFQKKHEKKTLKGLGKDLEEGLERLITGLEFGKKLDKELEKDLERLGIILCQINKLLINQLISVD